MSAISKTGEGYVDIGFGRSAKAEWIVNDIVVKVKHVGNTRVFRSNEILFTNDQQNFVDFHTLCVACDCQAAELLPRHLQSIGIAMFNKKLIPFLSTAPCQ